MDQYNHDFFEEFKRLDRLCRDIYQTDHGVTSYIEDMKAAAWIDSRSVPNWERDLARLKQLRHIRNQLAHEEEAFQEGLCISDDIDWLRDFYSRILNSSDPMALLYQNAQARQRAAQQPYPARQTSTSAPLRSDKRQARPSRAALVVAIGLIALGILGCVAVIAMWQTLPA